MRTKHASGSQGGPSCLFPSGNSTTLTLFLFLSLLLFLFGLTHLGLAATAVPTLIHYQGRVVVGDTGFNGTGHFKFSLVNTNGSEVFWSNSPDANTDGEPDAAVTVPVDTGLYSILLGDTSLPQMSALPIQAFTAGNVFLRVWFNDGTNGFQQLTPDHRVAAVAYALVAASVPEGTITSAQLANAAVTAAKLAPGALRATNLTGTLLPAQLPANIAYKDPDLRAVSNALSAQLAALTARVDSLSTGGSGIPAGLTAVSASSEDPLLESQGFRRFMNIREPGWNAGATAGAPGPRAGNAAAWTGSEWILWGGEIGVGVYSQSGAAYQADSDQWLALPTLGAPSPRRGASAVWSGSEVIYWGGFGSSGYLNSGARLDAATRQWTSLPAAPAGLEGRDGHVAAWTGSRMVIWGGRNAAGALGTGATYQPTNNTWTLLNISGAPAPRYAAASVWTGQRQLIWGGQGTNGLLNTGGQLRVDDSGTPFQWQSITTTGAPSPRRGASAVWTGQRMIVWGGEDAGGQRLGNGGIYDPVANTWSPLSNEGAPSPRIGHVAVWTGDSMLIVAGEAQGGGSVNDGAAYDPSTNSWRPLSVLGGPQARTRSTAAWTGTELLIFGGQFNGENLAALERLDPQPAWYFYRKL